MNYGKALVMAEGYEKGICVLKKAKNHLNTTIIETALGDAHKALENYNEAEEAYEKAAYMIPNRLYPHYLLAKLYVESQQYEKARNKAREVLEKEVKVPSTAVREMRLEMERLLKSPLVIDSVKNKNIVYNHQKTSPM